MGRGTLMQITLTYKQAREYLKHLVEQLDDFKYSDFDKQSEYDDILSILQLTQQLVILIQKEESK